MTTRKLLSFSELSDSIAKRLLIIEPGLTTKEAATMGHDLARAVLRPFFNGGEVPTHFDIDTEAISRLAGICREGLLSA